MSNSSNVARSSKLRFNFLNLLLLITVVALSIALFQKRTSERLVLIGGDDDTWELPESAVLDSQWLDKSQPPRLSVSEAYKIARNICEHLNSVQESTRLGFWEPLSVSMERLQPVDNNQWAYSARIEGTDYPEHPGQSLLQQVVCMILLDKTVVFDSGSCPDQLLDIMSSYPGIVDAAPTVNQRPANEGGVL